MDRESSSACFSPRRTCRVLPCGVKSVLASPRKRTHSHVGPDDALTKGRRLVRACHPENWCVTKANLVQFEHDVRKYWNEGKIPNSTQIPNKYHDDPEIGPNMYQVNEYFIKPVTLAAGGMSYALMCNPVGLQCEIFVAHAWVGGVFEFVSSVKRAWPAGRDNLWCSILAIPQNLDITDLLDFPVQFSPFGRALASALHVIIVPNSICSISERLWCVFEIHEAIKAKKDILMPQPKDHRRTKRAPLLQVAFVYVCGLPLGLLGDRATSRRTLVLYTPIPFACYVWSVCAHVVFAWNFLSTFDTAYVSKLSTRIVQLPMARYFGFNLGYSICDDAVASANFVYRRIATHAIALLCSLNVLQAEDRLCEAPHDIGKCVTQPAWIVSCHPVRDARCLSTKDEKRIRSEIKGREGQVDHAMKVLMQTKLNANDSGRNQEPEKYNTASAILCIFVWADMAASLTFEVISEGKMSWQHCVYLAAGALPLLTWIFLEHVEKINDMSCAAQVFLQGGMTVKLLEMFVVLPYFAFIFPALFVLGSAIVSSLAWRGSHLLKSDYFQQNVV